MRILLVEDEDQIRELLKLNLVLEGYEVETAADGLTALNKLGGQHFDLVILDVMLPEVSGLQIAENFRLTNRDTPILMLTAKDASSDRIAGLKMGADDYLTKPFVLEELMLRVQNLLRRTTKNSSNTMDSYGFAGNTINFITFEATTPNGTIELTKKEALLLKLLIDRKNEVVSRHQILQTVWGYDVYPSTRTIDNFILSFRKYFEVDPKEPVYFHSVRGVGYKFVA